MPVAYYKTDYCFFVGRSANSKVCASKKPLRKPFIYALKPKKSKVGYNFPLLHNVTAGAKKKLFFFFLGDSVK